MFYFILFILGSIVAITLFKHLKPVYSYTSELSKCESPIEQKVVKHLKERGYKPYTQVPEGKFRIDVALYGKHGKLAIECDGQQWHSSPDQVAHDDKKDRYLEQNKWKVVRLTGKEIYHDIDWCMKYIESNVKY